MEIYHRILIPGADKYVHHFLWRNFETDRDPDVYVKTILIFGDERVPATAQIALRKTALLAKGGSEGKHIGFQVVLR